MKVLVACEYSGRVREAFLARGHFAVSCDLLPSDIPGDFHYEGDIRDVLGPGWDLMIAFPPCTYLSKVGARHWPEWQESGQQQEALEFVRLLMNAPIERIAIENPVGKISTAIRKPEQIIQPYWFGEEYIKTTCLWLKNLPLLEPTEMVSARTHYVDGGTLLRRDGRGYLRGFEGAFDEPGPGSRAHKRARTFRGIAGAMAVQWGGR